jgi:hypothetical protein
MFLPHICKCIIQDFQRLCETQAYPSNDNDCVKNLDGFVVTGGNRKMDKKLWRV